MLTYSFEERGELPLYEYLYRCIADDIKAGRISAHEKLPSKRSLAKHLGISIITVENAYAQLAAEGFITSRQRQGYFACNIPSSKKTSAPASSSIKHDSTHFRISSLAQEEALQQTNYACENSPFFDLTTGIANDIFPYSSWAKCLRDVLIQEPEKTLVAETTVQGVYKLRQYLCEYLKEYRGMSIEPEQIVIGSGSQYLYGLLAQFFNAKTKIALEDPGYPLLYKVYASHHIGTVSVPLDEGGINLQELKRSKANVAHVVPSHQFPTGMVTSIARRYELLAWASEKDDALIIEDDYDCQFRLSGRPIPPLCNLDTEGKVIYTNTFSKSLGPAFRIAYLILPKNLVDPFLKKLGFYSCPVSALDQLALAYFIKTGHYERHINRLKTRYKVLRNALIEELKRCPLGCRLVFKNEDAGLHFLLGYKTTTYSSKELARLAKNEGVLLKPLDEYCFKTHTALSVPGVYYNNHTENDANQPSDTLVWFVVNYGGISENDAAIIAQALTKAWGNQEKDA